jgi:hypothetical protein
MMRTIQRLAYNNPIAIASLLFLVCACGSAKISGSAAIDPGIVARSAWNAAEPRPYKQHVPVRITIHHEGTRLEVMDDAAKKIKNIQTWGMGPDRKWTDIPYHYLISPAGVIYEGRNPNTVGETNTEYDPSGHLLICCLGNLEQQRVTKKQLNALTRLLAWSCKQYNIPDSTIASHKDYSKITNCPGKNLYRYLQNGYIKSNVKKLLLAK